MYIKWLLCDLRKHKIYCELNNKDWTSKLLLEKKINLNTMKKKTEIENPSDMKTKTKLDPLGS